MRKHGLGVCLVGSLLTGLMASGAMAAFAPLFQVIDVKGACMAQPPAGESKKLEGGEGLAFGTTIRTGSDGSLTVVLSSGNTIMIGPNAVIGLGESAEESSMKLLQLFKGRAELVLEKDFSPANGIQVLTRCVRANIQSGGGAVFEASSEADLKVTAIMCKGAQIDLAGPEFLVAMLKDDDAISIACSDDRQFVRLRDLNGTYMVQVKEAGGVDRLVEMQKDAVIKILIKASEVDPGILVVSVLEVGPDGNVLRADTYEHPRGTGYGLLATDDSGGDSAPALSSPELDLANLSAPFVTTTTTTTTTTVPPGDLLHAAEVPLGGAAPQPTSGKPPKPTKPPETPTGNR